MDDGNAAMTKLINIPLFPLNTVLFPNGVLPLRIFEPRYLDMVSESLKQESEIGVIQIREGKEVGPAAQVYSVGTLTNISYWNKRNDGLLGITLKGTRRFRILAYKVHDNQLVTADVEVLDNCQSIDVQAKYQCMSRMLRKIISQLEPPFTTMGTSYDDLEWVSARLCELLPLSLDYKQELLESDDVFQRIEQLYTSVQETEVG